MGKRWIRTVGRFIVLALFCLAICAGTFYWAALAEIAITG